ncbi:uncharacterized protein LOC129581904 [Paramacrobiotus metropolitanus]|uniref:uncharacterized protein LOC129581904 n=1 Tax=Paramacrobiotus metropolitanus TaxID=2943436 RepID=UPI002445F48B|nr:uncharacterized protein LOC129581904 [Paramacrobiotus metropolitanus]
METLTTKTESTMETPTTTTESTMETPTTTTESTMETPTTTTEPTMGTPEMTTTTESTTGPEMTATTLSTMGTPEATTLIRPEVSTSSTTKSTPGTPLTTTTTPPRVTLSPGSSTAAPGNPIPATPPPISAALESATNNATYPNATTYYLLSTHRVLNILQNAAELTFNDVRVTANYFRDFATMNPPEDLPEGAQKDAVETLLQITYQIVSAESSGKLKVSPSPGNGHRAAVSIYQALEQLYHKLPASDESYIRVFITPFCVTYVYSTVINGSSQFDDLRFSNNLEIGGFDWGTGITAVWNGSTGSVTSTTFNKDVLREVFEDLKKTVNATEAAKFTFSLSAMVVFKFAEEIPANELNERASPLVLLASLNDDSQRRNNIVTTRHNVDILFNYPSGAKRRHACTFLNYGTDRWSIEGCSLTAKYPKWDNTIVECTGDHLTPFSLFLTLCSSLSRSLVPNDAAFTMDLAVVTTATTGVAAVCCVFALIIIMVKIYQKSVVFDEVMFTRMGLWVALLGMYTFSIFSQLMVYIPEMCGQQFCLASAILVHWFALMSIGWTAVQTVGVIQVNAVPGRVWAKGEYSWIHIQWIQDENSTGSILYPNTVSCFWRLFHIFPRTPRNFSMATVMQVMRNGAGWRAITCGSLG